MKNNFIYILTLLAVMLTVDVANAQKTYSGDILFSQPHIRRENSQVMIDMQLDLRNIRMRRQGMVTLTPYIISQGGNQRVNLDPVVVASQKRYRVLNRKVRLRNFHFEQEPAIIIMRHRNNGGIVDLSYAVPYEQWMRKSDLMMGEVFECCAGRTSTGTSWTLKRDILPAVHVPTFELVYAVPPAEAEKQRSASHAARINFVVNRVDIQRNFSNNAEVLAEVDRIIRTVKDDKDLTITKVQVTGFASPEGGEARNIWLSEHRARAFASYLIDDHGIDRKVVAIDWKGEDWDGLRKVISESTVSNRTEILAAIDIPDVNRRKAAMKALPNYRELLNTYYPPLRRNDYRIDYVARPFDVNEAREVIKTRPQYLSLNEMFLVANTLDRNSDEFKNIFDVAARMYPNDVYARVNSGTLEIERGAVDAGMNRLRGIDSPYAWNSLGVAYAKQGDYQQAAQYLRRAADAGLPMARQNLNELNLMLESM